MVAAQTKYSIGDILTNKYNNLYLIQDIERNQITTTGFDDVYSFVIVGTGETARVTVKGVDSSTELWKAA